MKFNLKLFVLVGVLAGFRDVCGMEKKEVKNKDYGDFIVSEELLKFEGFEDAMKGNRVIKAVYKTEVGGDVKIIHKNFKDKLYKVLVCAEKNVDEKDINALVSDGYDNPYYYMQENVKYTVYFIFNNGNVDSTERMFSWCNDIISADFRCFNTTNVKDMSYMFYKCSSLTELNLSSFDTKNVINMSFLFYSCTSLKQVFLPSKDARRKKRCICCGDEYVCWNNHEVEGLNPKIVQDKNPEEIIKKIPTKEEN